MPTLYVTYHDPLSNAITTAAIETPLSPRVFRAMILAEGLALPDGRAVLPACLRGVSERRPVEATPQGNGARAGAPSQDPPGPPASAPAPAPVRPPAPGPNNIIINGKVITPEPPAEVDALTVHPPQRTPSPQPKPPAERSRSGSDGGAAAPRPTRTRKRA
jgi:hypothetical protein